MSKLFKLFWTKKSVGDELNADLKLIQLDIQILAATEKGDWDKVAQLKQEIARIESQKNSASKSMLLKSDLERIDKAVLKSKLSTLTKQDNPFAICTESVGRDDKAKYESCVMHLKEKFGIKKDFADEHGIKDDTTIDKYEENIDLSMSSEIDAEKDINISTAGKTPNSLLSRQDLEGDETETKKTTWQHVNIKDLNVGDRLDSGKIIDVKKNDDGTYTITFSDGHTGRFKDTVEFDIKKSQTSDILELVDESESVKENADRISEELGFSFGYVFDILINLVNSGKINLHK